MGCPSTLQKFDNVVFRNDINSLIGQTISLEVGIGIHCGFVDVFLLCFISDTGHAKSIIVVRIIAHVEVNVENILVRLRADDESARRTAKLRTTGSALLEILQDFGVQLKLSADWNNNARTKAGTSVNRISYDTMR